MPLTEPEENEMRRTKREARESWARPVTVVLGKTTAREALDALVRSHGGISWLVQRDRFGNAMLGLIGDGWTQAIGVPLRR